MNETLDAIAETLRSLLARHCSAETLRQADAGAWSAGLWAELDAAGVLLATVPESAGGLGFGLGEAAFIARVVAAHAAPVPVAETLLAHWLWHRGEGVVAGVPSAERLTVHIAQPGSQAAQALAAGGPVTATLPGVPWARHADALVLVVPGAEASLLARVPLGGVRLTPHVNLADEPRDDVHLAGMSIGAQQRRRVAETGEQATAYLALLRAAQLVGAMEAAVAITVQYANERVQFGKPIGRFQAIQSHVAGAAELVASAAVALEQAAASAADPAREPLLWMAKALASESAGHVAAAAHQVHGAIGFTREYRLQTLTRRLWAWREECGNEDVWYAKLGAMVLANGADALWPWITDMSPSAVKG